MTFKSPDNIKKALSASETLEIETSDIQLLLDKKGLNSLLFTEPFSKLCFTCSAVSEFLRRGTVIYIDLDTVFTSYVRKGIFPISADAKDLLIYLPAANEFEEMLGDICSTINSRIDLIVMDSLNSFYHLYDGIRIGPLNHLLSSYVSLLLNHSITFSSTLLVTSMIRHKKRKEWILAPSSKRLIESKSSVVLMADLLGGNLTISLLKHGQLQNGSAKLLLRKGQIPIVP
ncbi:MAG: hypothetical protein ACE5KA_01120 [Nitrososphaerales archaeon]